MLKKNASVSSHGEATYKERNLNSLSRVSVEVVDRSCDDNPFTHVSGFKVAENVKRRH